MRAAFLFPGLSSYFLSCCRALKQHHGAELFAVHWPESDTAPYAFGDLSWIDQRVSRADVTRAELSQRLLEFGPDVLYVPGWVDIGYLRIARAFRRQGTVVVAGLDTQWRGTAKQIFGSQVARRILHSTVDVLWAAGDRQRYVAKRLGYSGAECWEGLYCCDWKAFANVAARPKPKTFLFVGRYVEGKGVRNLVEAYGKYRQRAQNPWPLLCAGLGPLAATIKGNEGIRDLGFVQPDALPEVMAEAGCLVLPSRREPWGVVLQEAAAAGLPLIASDACGAAVHLLRDGYNGFLCQPGDVQHLANCLLMMSASSAECRETMGVRSFELSKQYTPETWADTLVRGVFAMRGRTRPA